MRKVLLIALGVVAALLVILAGVYVWLTWPTPTVRLATWTGTYGRAQSFALMAPYKTATGIDLRIAHYDGGTSDIEKQVASKTYDWDVVDLELPDAVKACDAGLLEKLDTAALPNTGDFVKGAVGPCWVGSMVYSQIIAYSPTRFAANTPRTLRDVFDLQNFPGPRALKKASAKFNLEMALLASGVAPSEIYKTLETEAGIAKALAKLNTLKPWIIWIEPGDKASVMIAQGQAAFGAVLNGEVFDAEQEQIKLGIIWDGQLYQLDVFAIPAGNPNKKRAFGFIQFATSPESLARVAEWVPYGPSRRSALTKVGRNPELNIEMSPWLPTQPANFRTAFLIDDAWWQKHGPRVEARWQSWLAQN